MISMRQSQRSSALRARAAYSWSASKLIISLRQRNQWLYLNEIWIDFLRNLKRYHPSKSERQATTICTKQSKVDNLFMSLGNREYTSQRCDAIRPAAGISTL